MTVTTPRGDHDGPLLDLLAKLHVSLGGVDESVKKINAEYTRRQHLNQNVVPLSLELIPVGTSAIYDKPDLMGPRTGWYWDIQTVICQAMAGSSSAITMFAKTVVNSGTALTGVQWGVFNSNGQLNWGKKQFTLGAGERIAFSGNASITTAGIISVYGTQVAAPYWGDYAL